MVKEAQEHVYGKWNLPGGHLDLDENLLDAMVREAKEETNLDVKLEGLIGIYQHKNKKGNNVVKFIFMASVVNGQLKYRVGELLDAKWFSFDEFNELSDEELRTTEWRKVVKDYRNRGIKPLDLIRITGL